MINAMTARDLTVKPCKAVTIHFGGGTTVQSSRRATLGVLSPYVVDSLVDNLLSPHDLSLYGCTTVLTPEEGYCIDPLGITMLTFDKNGSKWTIPKATLLGLTSIPSMDLFCVPAAVVDVSN